MFQTSPQLRAAYIKNRVQDLNVLSNSLQLNSIEEFHRIGHQLVGNAPNFGFPELAVLGDQMESLTPAQFSEVAKSIVEELKKWVARHAPRESSEGTGAVSEPVSSPS